MTRHDVKSRFGISNGNLLLLYHPHTYVLWLAEEVVLFSQGKIFLNERDSFSFLHNNNNDI